MSTDDLTMAEMGRTMVRIEGKLDKVTADHEDRLRRLEKAVWIATGTGAAGLASSLAAILTGVTG